MAGFKFPDRAIGGQRRGDANEREIVMNRFKIDVAADLGVKQQRAEFRSKDQLSVDLRVQERLLADAIARQKKRFRLLVPNGKGKHAAQILRKVSTIFI